MRHRKDCGPSWKRVALKTLVTLALLMVVGQASLAWAQQGALSVSAFSGGDREPAELLGQFRLKDFVLRPTLAVVDQEPVELSLSHSSLAVSWWQEPDLSVHFRLGPRSLRNSPRWYGLEVEQREALSLHFVEAYVQRRWLNSQISLGLIPLKYSLEGALTEGDLVWPRGLLFSERWVGLRDYGLSWDSSHNGFFTRLNIHHGETSANLDGRYWFTGTWGWSDQRNLILGASAQSGRTTASSTDPDGLGFEDLEAGRMAGFDPELPATWSQGTVFLAWGQRRPRSWHLHSQWTYLRRTQEDFPDSERKRALSGFQADLTYIWNEQLWSLLRYDRLENWRSWMGGLAWHSHSKTSSLIWLYSEKSLRGSTRQEPERKLELQWRLSPLAQAL